MRLPCVGFKNRSTGRDNEDRSEPSPRLASKCIAMKTRPKNLQGDEVEIKLSLVSIRDKEDALNLPSSS